MSRRVCVWRKMIMHSQNHGKRQRAARRDSFRGTGDIITKPSGLVSNEGLCQSFAAQWSDEIW